jgi:hypothetical protein
MRRRRVEEEEEEEEEEKEEEEKKKKKEEEEEGFPRRLSHNSLMSRSRCDILQLKRQST